MKGFGVVESGKRVGWIKKDIPRPGKFEALARPAAIAPCTSDVHLAGRPAVPEGRILGHEDCRSWGRSYREKAGRHCGGGSYHTGLENGGGAG